MGFPFHEACWVLLTELFAPSHVEPALKKLIPLLSRAMGSPVLGSQLWTSNPIHSRSYDLISWGELRAVLGDRRPLFASGICRQSYVLLKSLDIPGFERIMQESLANPPVNPDAQRNLNVSIHSGDIFSVLPLEILQELLLCLPSKDVLSLKFSSSVFAVTPLAETFWASRFQRGFEFHCFFEARK